MQEMDQMRNKLQGKEEKQHKLQLTSTNCRAANMRETHWGQQIVRNQKKRKQMNGMLQSKPMFSKEEEVESLLKIAPMPS